ncbi:MAG: AAA family ATPase [Alcanivoracaceae bacterium]|nr:AAA family ATPase [Alcanivoracaceae bacterium]
MEADYWKPIQAGEVKKGDNFAVKNLLSNPKSIIYPNSYALHAAMSPHAAAELDDVNIKIKKITPPATKNHLVIEGAGGLLVPINETETIIDIIKADYHVIVVSRHYLGSINHSLMTIKLLQQRGFMLSLIFNGEENPATEEIIVKMTNINVIGRINQETEINKAVISKYAHQFKDNLRQL